MSCGGVPARPAVARDWVAFRFVNSIGDLPHRYFAYGSNLSDEVMAERCPGAIPVGRARIDGRRFLINERGVATVVLDADSSVHGLRWATDDRHLRALDGVEGLAAGKLHPRTDCGLPADYLDELEGWFTQDSSAQD